MKNLNTPISYFFSMYCIELQNTCYNYLRIFDDYQQISFDNGRKDLTPFFVDSYNKLEKIYFQIKNISEISTDLRNQIRIIIKSAYKIINELS